MPLAIEIIAALLSTKNLVLQDIIKDYIEHVVVYKPRPLQWSYDKHRSIEEILELIIDAIKDDETHAAKLLIMSCLMGPTEISLIAFENLRSLDITAHTSLKGSTKSNLPTTGLGLACSAWLGPSQSVKPDFMAAFNQLEELGLARPKRNPSGRVVAFSIHSLIRTLSLRRLRPDEKRELISLLARSLCDSLDHGSPSWKRSNPCVQLARMMVEQLREVVNDVELLISNDKIIDLYRTLFANLGAFFMEGGRFSDAQDAYGLVNHCDILGRQAGSLLTKSSLASMQDFALACRSNGNLDQAAEVFQHIYEESLNTYGLDDVATKEAAEWSRKLKTQLSRRAANEISAAVSYSSPKAPLQSFPPRGEEAPAVSASVSGTTSLNYDESNTFSHEHAYEILELAKENHALGRTDTDAIESFLAASRHFRTTGLSHQHEAWFIRAWEACSAYRGSDHEWNVDVEVVYQLLVFYFEDPPAGDILRRLTQTAVFRAVQFGHEPIVKLFLKHDIDPAAMDTDGRNLLHYAALSPKATVEIICSLIEHGVSLHDLDNQLNTPINLCLQRRLDFNSLRKFTLFLSYTANDTSLSMWEELWPLMLSMLIRRWHQKTGATDKQSLLELFRYEARREEFMSIPIKSWWDVHWRTINDSTELSTLHDYYQHIMLLIPILRGDLQVFEELLTLLMHLQQHIPALLIEAARLRELEIVQRLLSLSDFSKDSYLSHEHIPLLVAIADCHLESALLLLDNNAKLPLEKFSPEILEEAIRDKPYWLNRLSQDDYLNHSEMAALRKMLSGKSSFIKPFLRLLRNAAARSKGRRIALAKSLRQLCHTDGDFEPRKNQSMTSIAALTQHISPLSIKKYIGRR